MQIVEPVISNMNINLSEERYFPLDVLNRDEIVFRLVSLIEILAETNSSCTFALNGKWGIGKSFVLNMLEEQLRQIQTVDQYGDKYLVIHYNCWKYDYYEEPVLAIIAAIKDEIDRQTNLISESTKQGVNAALSVASEVMLNITNEFVKNKIGFSIMDTIHGAKETLSDDSEFAGYLDYGKTIENVRTELKRITATTTLVIVVDEMDRCLPEYAIKTLERLHHLFHGMNNVISVIAIDKGQLDRTVNQIFGNNVNTKEYLKKFISFEVLLGSGEVNDNFLEKYARYLKQFDSTALQANLNLDKFVSALFDRIDIRTTERIMEKVQIIHPMIFPGNNDYSVLCTELFLAVLNDYYGYNSINEDFDFKVDFGNCFDDLKMSKKVSEKMNEYFLDLFSNVKYVHAQTFRGQKPSYVIDNPIGNEGLLWYWYHLHKNKSFELFLNTPNFSYFNDNFGKFKSFCELLETIN